MSGELDPAVREALGRAGRVLLRAVTLAINERADALRDAGFDPCVVALPSINASASLLANALATQTSVGLRQATADEIISEVRAAVRHSLREHAGPVTIQ